MKNYRRLLLMTTQKYCVDLASFPVDRFALGQHSYCHV